MYIHQMLMIFVSKTCAQCQSLLSDPLIRTLQSQHKIVVYDLYSILPHTREIIFSNYNRQRLVPFMVVGRQSIIGKDNILAYLRRVGRGV